MGDLDWLREMWKTALVLPDKGQVASLSGTPAGLPLQWSEQADPSDWSSEPPDSLWTAPPSIITKSKFFIVPDYDFDLHELTDSTVPVLWPSLDAVPDGDYVVEVISSDYKRSLKENPMVVVELEITDGAFAGRTLNAYFVVREFGLIAWDKFVEACGITEDPNTLDLNSVLSRRLGVTVFQGFVRGYSEI